MNFLYVMSLQELLSFMPSQKIGGWDILTILLYVVAISAAVMIWCLCVLLLWLLYQRKQEVSFTIQMENTGNVETPLQVKVDLGKLAKGVKVFWWTNNQRQRTKSIPLVSFVDEVLPPSAKPAPVVTPAPAQKKSEKQKKESPGVKDKAEEKFGMLKGVAYAVASISSGLATILPGPLKKPFKALATNIQRTQSNASQVMSEPERLATSGRQMKANVKRLKNPGGAPKPGQASSSQAAANPTVAASSVQQVGQVERRVRRKITRTIQVIETRLLNPAEKVIYRLVFRPNNPFARWAGPFAISSQQLEYDDFPSYNEIKPRLLEGNLEIRRMSAVFIVLFLFVCLFILVFNMWCSLALVQWLRGFLPVF
jgi:hypothetical protein